MTEDATQRIKWLIAMRDKNAVHTKKLACVLLAMLCFLASGLFLYAFVWACTTSMLTVLTHILCVVSFALTVSMLAYLSGSLYEARRLK